jgi:hypothetical protein
MKYSKIPGTFDGLAGFRSFVVKKSSSLGIRFWILENTAVRTPKKEGNAHE